MSKKHLEYNITTLHIQSQDLMYYKKRDDRVYKCTSCNFFVNKATKNECKIISPLEMPK